MSAAVKLFAGSGTNELASKIANHYGKKLGTSTAEKFSDGELSYHFNESVRGCHVFLIQSTFGSDRLHITAVQRVGHLT